MYIERTGYRDKGGKLKIFSDIPVRIIYLIDTTGAVKDRIEVSW